MKTFFRDLFLLPSSNGERRLVRNFFTRKMVWTKGKEPEFKENHEIKKMLHNTDSKRVDSHASVSFEPIKNRRFVIDFPGIDSFIFKGYKFLGEDTIRPKKEVSEFHVYIPIAQNVDVDFYSKKSKKVGSIKLLILDATGLVIRTIELDNSYVEHIYLYEEFDYEKDDIQIMKLRVSHSPRKIS